ncbi:MAG: TetR/AcrR family transcriptional regulator [Deltaproteobacteria bacterium]|nr:TetR/AcrR family transcriptional regulator [Deltaproteobacteria bacterium]
MARQPTVTKEKLIEAAATTILRFGLRKTTLEDIGKVAGVTKAAVLYHFHSKEELIATVVEQEYQGFFDSLRGAVEREPTAEGKLRAFGLGRFQYTKDRLSVYAAYGDVTREVLESLMPLVRAALERLREKELELLRGILSDGMRSGEFAPGDPDLMAMAAMAALTGLSDAFMLYGRESRIDEGLQQLFRLLMDGLRRRSA